MDSLSPEQIAALETVLGRLTPDDRAHVETASQKAAGPAATAALHWDYVAPALQAEAALGPNATDAMRRGLIASWLRELPHRIRAEALPAQVLDLYPSRIDGVVRYLVENDGAYDLDYWAKDVRFALALSVPSPAQMIDLSFPMGPGESVRHFLGGRGLGAMIGYGLSRGWRPWLQVHTDTRFLDDFNEAGWDRTWETVAALLKTRPGLAGVVAASWFYDPPLETISPRLAYLRRRPVDAGAFMVHQGPDPIHTERATATSPSRRAMVEAGDYTPRGWLVAWPRKALIRWADSRAAP